MVVMSGVSYERVCQFGHDDNKFNNDKRTFCLSALWYSTSDESYAQRTSIFDNTFFHKDSPLYNTGVDEFLKAYLTKVLGLTSIVVFDNADNLETFLYEKDSSLSEILLLYDQNKQSLLYTIDSKMRNSIAHGTMNFYQKNSAVFYGQYNKKQDSKINFYLKTDRFDAIERWYQERHILSCMDLIEFQRMTYSLYFGELRHLSKNCYIQDDGACVVFDNEFRFRNTAEAGNQETQIVERIDNLWPELNTMEFPYIYYFIMDRSNSYFRQFTEKCPNITIIPYNKLGNFFDL